MNNKSEHGKIFKKLRLERGLKLKEVAGDIISTQTLRRFEADETSVSIAVLEKLLENLGVDYIDYMLALKSSIKDSGSVILTEAYQLLREGNPSAVLTLATRKLKEENITLKERLSIARITQGIKPGVVPEIIKENNRFLLKHFQSVDKLSYEEQLALNTMFGFGKVDEITIEYIRRVITENLNFKPGVEMLDQIPIVTTFYTLLSSISYLSRCGYYEEAQERCYEAINLLKTIGNVVPGLNKIFYIRFYGVLIQIKLRLNDVEGVELANKLFRELDASIALYDDPMDKYVRDEYMTKFYKENKTGVEFDF